MRLGNPNGVKADHIIVNVRNHEVSATILAGQPVVLDFNGTDNGVGVVLPSSATAGKVVGLFYGVNLRDMAPNQSGESMTFGFAYNVRLVRQTRATSTDVWASEAARSVGEFLKLDTVNNGFVTVASATSLAVPAIIAGTLALYASSASSTADTRTALTAACNAFIVCM